MYIVRITYPNNLLDTEACVATSNHAFNLYWLAKEFAKTTNRKFSITIMDKSGHACDPRTGVEMRPLIPSAGSSLFFYQDREISPGEYYRD